MWLTSCVCLSVTFVWKHTLWTTLCCVLSFCVFMFFLCFLCFVCWTDAFLPQNSSSSYYMWGFLALCWSHASAQFSWYLSATYQTRDLGRIEIQCARTHTRTQIVVNISYCFLKIENNCHHLLLLFSYLWVYFRHCIKIVISVLAK